MALEVLVSLVAAVTMVAMVAPVAQSPGVPDVPSGPGVLSGHCKGCGDIGDIGGPVVAQSVPMVTARAVLATRSPPRWGGDLVTLQPGGTKEVRGD